MNYKANFKVVIMAHLMVILLLSLTWFFVAAAEQFMMKIIMAVVAGSLVVQSLMYKIRPGWFKSKVHHHPDQL